MEPGPPVLAGAEPFDGLVVHLPGRESWTRGAAVPRSHVPRARRDIGLKARSSSLGL
jgi:hypothetical protein